MNVGALLVDVAAETVKKIRNRPKAVAKRAARAARKASRHIPDQEVTMGALKSALKSKTIWFGLLLSIAGAVELFLQTDVTPLVDGDPVALIIIGIAVKVLRAVTSKPLLAK